MEDVLFRAFGTRWRPGISTIAKRWFESFHNEAGELGEIATEALKKVDSNLHEMHDSRMVLPNYED
jgi:hypothetical protein